MPSRILRCALIATTAFCGTAHATIVQFQTVLGNFQVNLYDETTPQTVQNFLNYVNDGDFSQSFIHRSVPGFVIQGGGFAWNGSETVAIPTDAAVNNEPQWSNLRGTIAMAKVGGNPNSATSQWFFSLANNSAILDAQNGGFTVFGEVIGDGMNVVDNIAQFSRFRFAAPFTDLPLRNYSSTDFNNGVQPTDNHLMMVLDVVVIDAATDTAKDLSPTPNTSLGGDGGSGAPSLLTLLLGLGLLSRRRTQSAT